MALPFPETLTDTDRPDTVTADAPACLEMVYWHLGPNGPRAVLATVEMFTYLCTLPLTLAKAVKTCEHSIPLCAAKLMRS